MRRAAGARTAEVVLLRLSAGLAIARAAASAVVAGAPEHPAHRAGEVAAVAAAGAVEADFEAAGDFADRTRNSKIDRAESLEARNVRLI